MRRLLAALALVLLAAVPAAAAVTVDDLRPYATAAGLPADFALVADDDAAASGFFPGGTVCMWWQCAYMDPFIEVGTGAGFDYALAAMLHEIGHYQQYRQGGLRGESNRWYEWDADAFSVQQLCRTGRNGPELLAALYVDVTDRVVIDSPYHGNHYRRIENVRNMRCSGLPRTSDAP